MTIHSNDSRTDGEPTDHDPTALPSRQARAWAAAAIIAAGVTGTAIGWRLAAIECTDGCVGRSWGYMLAFASTLSIGAAIVAAITLRASAEQF